MKGIGVILKKEREAKKITLEQVEEATKIRRKYLEAIEEEDFAVLPGEVYVKGFVATYLKYLGIKDRADVAAVMKPKEEPVDISEQLAAAEQVHAEQSAQKLQRSNKNKSSKKKEVFEEPPLTKNTKMILLISMAAILVLFVLQGVYSKWSPEVDDNRHNIVGEQQGEANNGNETIDVPDEPVVPEAPVYTDLTMTLEVLDVTAGKVDKCWMGIKLDGTSADVSLTEGQTHEVHAAQQIDLHLGNAGVVKVTINGQDLGVLGEQGKVVKQTFKLSDYVTDTSQVQQ